MAKEFTKREQKERKGRATEAANSFFQALKEGKDWRPFAQKHYKDWPVIARPLVVMFDDFECVRTGAVRGANPDVCIGVYVKLWVSQIAGSIPKREIKGRIAVWCEEGVQRPSIDGTWGVAPNSFRPTARRDNLDI